MQETLEFSDLSQVILADGTALETDYVVSTPVPAFLYIRVLGKTFLECATIFSDSARLQSITYADRVFEGYTRLMSIGAEDGAFKIQLTK